MRRSRCGPSHEKNFHPSTSQVDGIYDSPEKKFYMPLYAWTVIYDDYSSHSAVEKNVEGKKKVTGKKKVLHNAKSGSHCTTDNDEVVRWHARALW
jgi:hypothetical protein